MEKTGCKIICGAPTTLVVKGLMMMMNCHWKPVSVALTCALMFPVWGNALFFLVMGNHLLHDVDLVHACIVSVLTKVSVIVCASSAETCKSFGFQNQWSDGHDLMKLAASWNWLDVRFLSTSLDFLLLKKKKKKRKKRRRRRKKVRFDSSSSFDKL